MRTGAIIGCSKFFDTTYEFLLNKYSFCFWLFIEGFPLSLEYKEGHSFKGETFSFQGIPLNIDEDQQTSIIILLKNNINHKYLNIKF